MVCRSTTLLESNLPICPASPQIYSLPASTCSPFPRVTTGNPSVVHLLTLCRCAKREAQAALLARRLIKYNRRLDSQIVVLGDFNDFDNDCVGADGSTSITRVVAVAESLPVCL